MYNISGIRFLSAFIITLFVLTVFTGCSTATKYTYEEYKKIKAMDGQGSAVNLDDEEAYSAELSSFYTYLEEFSLLYRDQNNKLQPLMDSFDTEVEDIDRKKDYAEQIIVIEDSWIGQLDNMQVPDILSGYHSYFKDFLKNDRLFYYYFIEEDLKNANVFAGKASESFEASIEEMKRLESMFNETAQDLGLEMPF